MSRISVGTIVKTHELQTIRSERITVPDVRHLVHLQFRRFAGCPVCNLHISHMLQRQDEIIAALIHEVIVFHSSVEELQRQAGDLPFSIIADPTKVLYAEYGVESGFRALFDPHAWPPIGRAVMYSVDAVFRNRSIPRLNPEGGRFGLPAEFLIAGEGRVLACKYGTHAYDQWSVNQLLTLAAEKTLVQRMDTDPKESFAYHDQRKHHA